MSHILLSSRIHRVNMEKFNGKCPNQLCFILLFFTFWVFFFYFHSWKFQSLPNEYLNEGLLESDPPKQSIDQLPKIELVAKSDQDPKQPIDQLPEIEFVAKSDHDSCSDRYIYVHDLPTRFNDDMLKECQMLSIWTDMCRFLSNSGLGPLLENSDKVFSNKAIFVPFYAGLDISRYLWGFNTSTRDSASLDLLNWLVKKPEWRFMQGKDHFLVGGRITWDFRRQTDEESDWGNKFLFLPEAKNMTMLVIESSPWSSNDFGIPYPTYFHPSKDSEVFQWQKRMRGLKRNYLFSFAGAPRPNMAGSIRGQIIDQCRASKRGKLLECDQGESKCHSPSSIMKMFQSSVFCLQPQGDSYTRRSAFDSMLAGCIPVFFHPGSAYVQYTWHLPKNYTSYSVFIPEDEIREGKVSIEKRLVEIPPNKVKAMREEVIRLIPKLIYADPRSRLETLEDAFDVSVKGVIDRVNKLRREMREGISDLGFGEQNSWKYALMGKVGEHEWDPFFSNPKDGDN
ncbi:xyloglucan galactosyltransferase KATAMARI1 homolog isoform X2 [Tasmannia lanceolata]|uniref:xyloglucan galactosyltransferase KATAMARI1 homolog isoform X2 n=1 Tax=Tasmannia lanceolata TaxID=3420 RepID=UPI0040637FAB